MYFWLRGLGVCSRGGSNDLNKISHDLKCTEDWTNNNGNITNIAGRSQPKKIANSSRSPAKYPHCCYSFSGFHHSEAWWISPTTLRISPDPWFLMKPWVVSFRFEQMRAGDGQMDIPMWVTSCNIIRFFPELRSHFGIITSAPNPIIPVTSPWGRDFFVIQVLWPSQASVEHILTVYHAVGPVTVTTFTTFNKDQQILATPNSQMDHFGLLWHYMSEPIPHVSTVILGPAHLYWGLFTEKSAMVVKDQRRGILPWSQDGDIMVI